MTSVQNLESDILEEIKKLSQSNSGRMRYYLTRHSLNFYMNNLKVAEVVVIPNRSEVRVHVPDGIPPDHKKNFSLSDPKCFEKVVLKIFANTIPALEYNDIRRRLMGIE